MSSARLLVFHGSRNQQYSILINQLADLVRDRLVLKNLTSYQTQQSVTLGTTRIKTRTIVATISQTLKPLVEVAVLEFGKLTLAQKIVNFAQKAIALNYQRISIIPVFLAAGVHVREDIPQEIALARQKLGSSITIDLLDYIGNYSGLNTLVARQFARLASGRILLAHGSRLPQGNVASEQLGKAVNAKNAYWTVQPDLTSTVQLLVHQNLSSISIVPYFLFSGRITEAIASQVAQLQNQFPQTKLLLGQPLGATSALAQIIVESSD